MNACIDVRDRFDCGEFNKRMEIMMTTVFSSSNVLRVLRSFVPFVAACCVLGLISSAAIAAQASLAWDANPQPEVAGYMLHYGTVSGAYTNVADVGKVTSYTVPNLQEGKTYYNAVTAYDAGRAESTFSNEVTTTIPYSPPVANFSANSTSGSTPLSVGFTSTSTGTITGYSWSFGDGTTSTTANPTHSYAVAGTFAVGLTVSGPGGTNVLTKAGYILVSSASATAPVANFTADKTSGVAPLSVNFTSTSTGSITSYAWIFGDGTTSGLQNPTHSYAAAGSYNVSLTVSGSAGSNTMTKSGFVTATTSPSLGSEIIVDNLAAGIQDATRTFKGTWCTSSVAGPYGTSSLYACGGRVSTYRWSFSVPTTGSYDVYVRWSANANRSTAVPYTVAADTGLKTVNFNQQNNGNTWVLHGRYPFTAGVTKYIEVSAANGVASADAVRLVPATTVPTTTATTSLVAAYGFDEGTGTTVSDRSGKGNNGVISSATWTATGRFGKALAFNGTSSWVTVADSASLDLTTGMTLEAWVYPTTTMTGWRTVMMKEQPGADIYYLSANTDMNQPATGVSIGGSIRQLDAGTTIPVNAWTHLTATYDGTTQRLYINGAQVASQAQTGSIAVSGSAMHIGGNSVWGEYFQGLIDEVRIYNRALSPAEIQADMSKAVGP